MIKKIKILIYILIFIPVNVFSADTVRIMYIDFENHSLGAFADDSINKYWNVRNLHWCNDTTTHIVDCTDVSGSSSRMIQFKFPAGTDELQAGMEVAIDFDSVPATGDYTEVYMSYHFKFTAGSEYGYGGYKIPGLMGFAEWVGAVEPQANEGFIAHTTPDQHGLMRSYTYHHDQVGVNGDINVFGGFRIHNERWYTYTKRCVMNTYTTGTANQDGIIEEFINGKKLTGSYDIQYFEDTEEDDTLGIDGMWFSIFMSNNPDGTYDDSYILIDNIEIYQLDSTFASNNEYAWGVGDTNALGSQIYVPIALGSNTDTYDAEYTATSGTFKDLNGVGEYDNKTNELHKIYVKLADSISLLTDTVDVEDGFDIFQIIGNTSTVTPEYAYSARADTTDGTFMIDGEHIIIRLGSDYSNTDKGFQVTWEAYGDEDMDRVADKKGIRNRGTCY